MIKTVYNCLIRERERELLTLMIKFNFDQINLKFLKLLCLEQLNEYSTYSRIFAMYYLGVSSKFELLIKKF